MNAPAARRPFASRPPLLSQRALSRASALSLLSLSLTVARSYMAVLMCTGVRAAFVCVSWRVGRLLEGVAQTCVRVRQSCLLAFSLALSARTQAPC